MIPSLAIRSEHLLSLSLKLTFYKMFFVDSTVVVFVLLDIFRVFQRIFFQQDLCLHINPLNPELNPICYLLALLAHHFLHVSTIRVKSLTIRLLMSYIYIYIYMERLFLMFLDHTQRRSTVGRTPLDE